MLSTAPSYFPESYQGSEISSLSKVILVLGKARSHRVPNLGWMGLSHLGNSMFCQKNSAGHVMHDLVCCQSPVTHSFGLLNHPNSVCGGMFKLNTKFDADSLLYLLNHFERNSHTVHMLTQWHLLTSPTSTVMLSLLMHAHSSPLSLATRLH